MKAAPISQYKVGLCNIFLLHTSAAITINENWDADTRLDLSDAMDKIAPERTKELGPTELYRHNAEGADE